MIGYTLKHVLELVPEALPLVKQASVDAEYPISSKDNCLASALAINYKKNFTGETVDYDVLQKVANAVDLYNLEDTVSTLTNKMISRNSAKIVKQASLANEPSFLLKQANWIGDLAGMTNVREMSEAAEELFEKAASLNEAVDPRVEMYSGRGVLVKEAVLASLEARFSAVKDSTFVKIASAVGQEPDLISNPRTVKSLCSVINKLDEKHQLFSVGYNFVKEAMITKKASFTKCQVKVSGKEYPLEKILSLPSNQLDGYLGEGFTKELNSDPNSAKYLIESLPADSQQILATILKNV